MVRAQPVSASKCHLCLVHYTALSLYDGCDLEYFNKTFTQAKLLSTQMKTGFEYTSMLSLLYKMTIDEVVLMECIITFILNQVQQSFLTLNA